MELKPGYKQTEVGVIPEDWEIAKLCTIADLATGNTPPTQDKTNYGDEFLFVSPADLNNSKWILNTEKKLSKKGFSLARCFPRESILFTCIGSTIGKTGMAACELTSNQQINAVFPNAKYSSEFLYYLLDLISPKIKILAGQQAVPIINKKEFGETLLPWPPNKSEQTAIANALSDTDALIQSLTRLIAKKRQIKQGAMQTLLNPYENGQLKEGWVVKKLGDVANICRGASPRPIDSPKWFDENSDIGWVRISDITRAKKYLKTTVQKLTAEGVKHSRYVSSNNLIMSICATVGRPILNQIDICIHDGFVVFGNCTVDKQYLYYFLDSVEQDWSKHGQTGSQMNLNTRLINDTAFPMPKVFSEQTRIATILSGMDAEIAALEAKLAKYRHIKQGMMQNLLTGRIRLVQPDSNAGAAA